MIVCINSCYPVFYANTHPAKEFGYIKRGSIISKHYDDGYFYVINQGGYPWRLQYRKNNFATFEEWRNIQIESINE
jgi:hypothetical protein